MMEIPAALTESVIRRGTILHSDMFEQIDHGKFFVIMGVSEDHIVGFFFINSNINNYIFGKQELLDMQYPMRRSDYPFLRYDSFLCATKVKRVSKRVMNESIAAGITGIVGDMQQEHLDDVLEMVRNSDLFTEADKRKFFYK